MPLVDRGVAEARRLGEHERPEPRARLAGRQDGDRDGLRGARLAVGHRHLGGERARLLVGVRRVLLARVRRAVAVEVPAVGQLVLVGVRRRRGERDRQRGEARRRGRRHGAEHRRLVLGLLARAARLAVDGEVVEDDHPAGAGDAQREQAEPRRGHRVLHRLGERDPRRRRRTSTRPCRRCPSWSGAATPSAVPAGSGVELRLRVLDGAGHLGAQLDPVDGGRPVVGDQVELDVVAVVEVGEQAALLVAAAELAARPSSR